MRIFSAGIEAGALFLDPGKVAVTEDLGIGIIDLQAAEQGDERMLLSRSAGIVGLAVGIEASLVTDADGVGIVATGMGTNHFLGTALVDLSVLGDVIMVAGCLEASGLVTGDEGFQGKVLGDFRCGCMDDDKIYSAHNLEQLRGAALDGDGTEDGGDDGCDEFKDLCNGGPVDFDHCLTDLN